MKPCLDPFNLGTGRLELIEKIYQFFFASLEVVEGNLSFVNPMLQVLGGFCLVSSYFFCLFYETENYVTDV